MLVNPDVFSNAKILKVRKILG